MTTLELVYGSTWRTPYVYTYTKMMGTPALRRCLDLTTVGFSGPHDGGGGGGGITTCDAGWWEAPHRHRGDTNAMGSAFHSPDDDLALAWDTEDR